MDAGWLAGIVAAVGLTGGALWHAGQLSSILRELRDIARDHEERLRKGGL